jgi:hypothetical protein
MTQHQQAIRIAEIKHHLRLRQHLNATCPHCAADLVDQLKTAAYDWQDFSPPSIVVIDCHTCEAELTFDLHWNAVLVRAEQIEDTP